MTAHALSYSAPVLSVNAAAVGIELVAWHCGWEGLPMGIVGKIWIVCVCGSKRLTVLRRFGHSSFLFLQKYTVKCLLGLSSPC